MSYECVRLEFNAEWSDFVQECDANEAE